MTRRLRAAARRLVLRSALVVGLLVILVAALAHGAGPAAAQVAPTSEAVQVPGAPGTVDVEQDDAVAADQAADEETEREVRRAVIVLLVIAGVALVLTAAFWYHTIPSRRIIAARRERARAGAGAAAREGGTPVDLTGGEATEPAEKSTS